VPGGKKAGAAHWKRAVKFLVRATPGRPDFYASRGTAGKSPGMLGSLREDKQNGSSFTFLFQRDPAEPGFW